MGVARFVQLLASPEGSDAPRFAVLVAKTADGVVLVFNRWRRVWELPGGLIDAEESARDCAVREFREEAGGEPGELEWLGLVEVDDGSTHLGAVFGCTVRSMPETYESEETGGIAYWTRENPPSPLGHTDAALLSRYG